MKRTGIAILVAVLTVGGAAPAFAGGHNLEVDGFRLDFDGDMLVVSNGPDNDEAVEIDKDLELRVDGRKIRTDRSDRKLLRAYYEQAREIDVVATEIGLEGAKVGMRGAAIGVRALGKVLKLLDDDYDADDLEAEIEAETDAIEIDAEALELAAGGLEDAVEDLRDIGDELQERIPELEDLDWF